jgi:phosphocarrier protein FPr/phosphocarrier protein
MASLTLLAPLDGWCLPLAEVPDSVFAEGMIGDGLAIDPVSASVRAPCDGEVTTVPAGGHAVSIRSAQGVDVLVHVGIDSVHLAGRGFQSLVKVGQRVRAGDEVIRFDLDVVARGAKSLVTPVVVTSGEGVRIVRKHAPGRVRAGDVLMELEIASAGTEAQSATGSQVTRQLAIPLKHGLHARPAALLAKHARSAKSQITLAAHGKSADARSVTAVMALGVTHGDVITITANGPDASTAVDALVAGLNEALRLERAAANAPGAANDASGALAAARSASAANASGGAAASGVPDSGEAGSTSVRGADLAMAAARSASAGAATQLSRDLPAGRPAELSGVVAVAGFAIGRATRLERTQIVAVESGRGVAHETAELERARSIVRARLSRIGGAGDTTRREIAEAHLAFLDDPLLNETAQEHITAGKSAGFAWRAAIRQSAEQIKALGDARLRERVDDLLDIESHVLLALAGEARPMNHPLPENAVVLADELLPSELVALDRANLRAICLAGGGPTSHVAILAAAMNVPMLVGIGPALRQVPGGERVIVDASRGILQIAPSDAEFAQAEARAKAIRDQQRSERAAAQRECRTRDGTRIEIFANLGSVAEAEAAVSAGAEGCGLLRTEFLFIDRDSPPTEAEQLNVYQSIANALGPRPLVLRLMDVGGDKPLAYLPLPEEENPALGLRGIRTALRHPDLLRTQLRAALRVTPSTSVRILLPMVTEVAEIRTVRAIVDELRPELANRPAVEIGAMIETPAAALSAAQIARAVDFLSIGSNDLTQYTLAMDRGHPELARHIDALSPAVLKLIALVGAAGASTGKMVAVCGGVGADPAAIPLLIGMGVRELSVVPAAIPAIKRQVRELDIAECRALAEQAVELETAAEVRALTAHTTAQRRGA